MISPIRFYVCYDLVDFAVAFFLMGLPFAGWAALKAGQQWKKKRIAGTAGYSVTGLMCVALSMAVIFLDPVKTDFEMLRERYYINDMFRAFVYIRDWVWGLCWQSVCTAGGSWWGKTG